MATWIVRITFLGGGSIVYPTSEADSIKDVMYWQKVFGSISPDSRPTGCTTIGSADAPIAVYDISRVVAVDRWESKPSKSDEYSQESIRLLKKLAEGGDEWKEGDQE